MDNGVFVHGMVWVIVLCLTYGGTLYYRWKEGKAADDEKITKEQEELLKAKKEAARRA